MSAMQLQISSAVLAAVLVASAVPACAWEKQATKTVLWEIDTTEEGFLEGARGEFEYALRTRGRCASHQDSLWNHVNEPAGGGADAWVLDPGSHDWLLSDGNPWGVIPWIGYSGGPCPPRDGAHACGVATVMIYAERATEVPTTLKSATNCQVVAKKKASIHGDRHRVQKCGAKSEGTVTIPSAIVIGTTVLTSFRIGSVTADLKIKKKKLGEMSTKVARDSKTYDPIVLRLDEIETGMSYEEELMVFDGSSAGASEWSWDSTGVHLQAPLADPETVPSSIEISAAFESSWLTSDPGDFSVSIVNGEFLATGSLSALPWVVTQEEGQDVDAYLAVDYMPDLTMGYEIPAELIANSEETTYQVTLEYALDIDIEADYDEPVTTAVSKSSWTRIKAMYR